MFESGKGTPLSYVLAIESNQLLTNVIDHGIVCDCFSNTAQFREFGTQRSPSIGQNKRVQDSVSLVVHGAQSPKLVRFELLRLSQITSIIITIGCCQISC